MSRCLVLTVLIVFSTAAAFGAVHVPGDVADLQTALDQAQDGETIILAGGFYPVPMGGYVWTRSAQVLHIQAAPDSHVVLDGLGSDPIFRQEHPRMLNRSGSVIFENITFANGSSDTDGVAGGLTLRGAVATLVDCHFDNNETLAANSGGGAVRVDGLSRLYVLNSRFTGNRATRRGGALDALDESRVFILNSDFADNRVDLPGHHPLSSGGAIHADASKLVIANTAFRNNRAGHSGGAIHAREDWNRFPIPYTFDSLLYVANSYFLNNSASIDGSVARVSPSRGGAVHLEDGTPGEIYFSRFLENTAESGGAIASYRAVLTIEDTVFFANHATGSGHQNGLGGTLWIHSEDLNDASTEGGTINRPSATLSLRNSLFQGRTLGRSARTGGCLQVSGDTHRSFGRNGVSAIGNATTNRATVVIDSSVFDDCDVEGESLVSSSGFGGAVDLVHADLDMNNALIMNSDALGGGSTGAAGGMRLAVDSNAVIFDTTFAFNLARRLAAGLVFLGGELDINESQFFRNGLLPTAVGPVEAQAPGGVTLNETSLYVSPGIQDYGSVDTPAEGRVRNSSFISSNTPPIVEDDRMSGPVNDVRYNLNSFFGTPTVFSNPLVGGLTIAELNTLMILRQPPAADSDKSINPNNAFAVELTLGTMVLAPSADLLDGSPVEEGRRPAYVGVAWAGPFNAIIDGVPLPTNTLVRPEPPFVSSLILSNRTVTVNIERFDRHRFEASPQRNFFGPNGSAFSNQYTWTSSIEADCVVGTRDSDCLDTPTAFTSAVPEQVYVFMFGKQGGAWDQFPIIGEEVPEAFLVFDDDLETNDLTQWTSSTP